MVTATANKSETIESITRYIMRDKNAVAKRQIDRSALNYARLLQVCVNQDATSVLS